MASTCLPLLELAYVFLCVKVLLDRGPGAGPAEPVAGQLRAFVPLRLRADQPGLAELRGRRDRLRKD